MKWYDGIALALIYIAFVGVLIATAFIGRSIIFPEKAEAVLTTNTIPRSLIGGGCGSGGYADILTSSSTLSIFQKKTNTGGGSGSPCRLYALGTLPDTYGNLGFTELTIDYSVDVVSGVCTGVGIYSLSGSGSPNVFNLFQNTASSTTNIDIAPTSTTINIISYGASSSVSFGFGVYSYSPTANECYLNVTAVKDQNGINYLHFFDTDSGGGGGDTIINITDNGMTTSEWTCETTGDETICTATATTSVRQYDGPTYYEWLLVAGIMIFILFYMLWPRLSILKFRKE